MTDFVATLARKWCRHHAFLRTGVIYACECSRLQAAIHEALFEAEKIALAHVEQAPSDVVATGIIWRGTAARAIAAAIAALREGR